MKPLIVLIATFALSCLAFKLITGDTHFFLSGRIAMGIMLLFTSIAHFVFVNGMSMMLPAFIPAKRTMVYLTGVIEILGGAGLILSKAYHITAIMLIIFFVLILPSNIQAAKQKINLEKANYEGNGLPYLWFRIPLQAFFIAWVWFFAIAG